MIHKLDQIIGEFEQGFIYGNVKTHKINNHWRPIISQIPTPTYNLSKKLYEIITPYISKKYSLKSSDQFVDNIRGNQSEGILAYLDVESLFTNVPIDEKHDYTKSLWSWYSPSN